MGRNESYREGNGDMEGIEREEKEWNGKREGEVKGSEGKKIIYISKSKNRQNPKNRKDRQTEGHTDKTHIK